VAEYLDPKSILTDEHQHPDPHVWFDVSLWSEVAGVVTEKLSKFDPPNAAGYKKRGDAYRQEIYTGFAEDWAKIMGKNADVVLKRDDAYPPGEFDNCLVTKEWSGLEPGSVEQKYYCYGTGLVLVTEHSGKVLRSELTGGTAARANKDAFTFRTVPQH
jgi:hypothetical protein